MHVLDINVVPDSGAKLKAPPSDTRASGDFKRYFDDQRSELKSSSANEGNGSELPSVKKDGISTETAPAAHEANDAAANKPSASSPVVSVGDADAPVVAFSVLSTSLPAEEDMMFPGRPKAEAEPDRLDTSVPEAVTEVVGSETLTLIPLHHDALADVAKPITRGPDIPPPFTQFARAAGVKVVNDLSGPTLQHAIGPDRPTEPVAVPLVAQAPVNAGNTFLLSGPLSATAPTVLMGEKGTMKDIPIALSPLQGRKLQLETSVSAPLVSVEGAATATAGQFLAPAPEVSASSGRFSVNIQFGQLGWQAGVAEKVVQMASQNLKFAEIQLDPPELGPLQVRVSVNQDQASVVFNAASSQVREALEQGNNRLRELFANEGLNLVDVDVQDQGQDEQADEDGLDSSLASGAADDDRTSEESLDGDKAGTATLEMGVDDYV